MNENTKKILQLAIAAFIVTGLLVWGAFAIGLDTLADQEKLTGLLDKAGPLAPLIFFLIQFLQVIIAPIPGNIITLAGGAIFGFIWGSILSCAAVYFASLLVFAFGRRFGKKFAMKFISRETYDKYAPKLSGKGARSVIFSFFFLPMLPDDIICLMASILTDIPCRTFSFLVLAGRMPSVIVNILIGTSFHSENRLWIFIGGGLYYIIAFAAYYYIEVIKLQVKGGIEKTKKKLKRNGGARFRRKS